MYIRSNRTDTDRHYLLSLFGGVFRMYDAKWFFVVVVAAAVLDGSPRDDSKRIYREGLIKQTDTRTRHEDV